VKGLKVGIPREYFVEELPKEFRDAWLKAGELLAEGGATIEEVSLPNTPHALSTYYIIATAESYSNLARYDGIRYGSFFLFLLLPNQLKLSGKQKVTEVKEWKTWKLCIRKHEKKALAKK
jgi:Asp-tRNA(Asn)/Glu-tRNA(Gln) amidotransferase A subunit family amidase